ncbi:MAG: ATP-dependent zinc metalloprotease FtsH [Deltaproteobacteria bacterium]|nr:ATP-dependent zinc metalloprotease FtsH [Deltaproteobacteria bacterium]
MMVMFFVTMTRREGGVPPGVATFGKSSAKLAPEDGTGVTFKDVAGVDEGIEELQEIVQFLRTPNRFTALGGKIPKGVLLVGPPGTGKTLLARAVAGEAGVPFFSISGSDFVEMFVGVGAARVRDLFQKAAEQAPCIIFIDELDAVGKARGGNTPVGGQDEREQTLNQILVEMDGFDGRKGIIIVAATNRPETLDPALLRAGRFDRQVVVDRPDFKGREAILKVHARAMKLAEDVDLAIVARMTPGFAGADLANALNEAALLAARHDKKAIEMSDIDAAVERIVAGLEKKSRRLSEREKRVVAFHESGHAICAAASPGADPVQKISIIPRGVGALGYTLQTPAEDRYLMSRADLRNRIVTLYGGRVAEELVFEDVTTGASDDIRKASDLARRMVNQFGMSARMGAVDYGGEHYGPFSGAGMGGRDVAVSEETARQLDEEVRGLLAHAHDDARRVLLAHQDLLFRMSTQLLEEEVLDRDALATLLAEVRPLASLPELPALRAAWAQRELPALPVRLDKAPVFSLPEIDEATDGGEPQA